MPPDAPVYRARVVQLRPSRAGTSPAPTERRPARSRWRLGSPVGRGGMTSAARKRLDVLLVERGLADSREKAQALIMAGEVAVNGRQVLKAGTPCATDAEVQVREALRFVGRGGLKLERGTEVFEIDPHSASRWTWSLPRRLHGPAVQRGAARVYSGRHGHQRADYRRRSDPRVAAMERTNIRHLESLPGRLSLCVIDVSFISLRLVLPAVRRLLLPDADVVALVKPRVRGGPGGGWARGDSLGGGVAGRAEGSGRLVRRGRLARARPGYPYRCAARRATSSSWPICGRAKGRTWQS